MRNAELTDHLCRHCGIGRIEKVESAHGEVAFVCPNCERTHVGGTVEDMCFCGHTYPSGKPSGLRCIRNPIQTAENPHAVVVQLDRGATADCSAPARRSPVAVAGDL